MLPKSMKVVKSSVLEERVSNSESTYVLGNDSSPDVPAYKSHSERIIGDTLSRNVLNFTYEDRVYVEENTGGEEKGRLWYPDFHLNDSGVLIEYIGRPEDREYMKSIEKKMKVYDEMGAKVLWLFPEDIWEESNGKYSVRTDAGKNILKKVHARLEGASSDDELRTAQVDARAFNSDYSQMSLVA